MTGYAAIYLAQHPGTTPASVQSAIVAKATPGVISGIKAKCTGLDSLLGTCQPGTPNLLLYTGTGSAPPPPPPPPPANCPSLNRVLGLC